MVSVTTLNVIASWWVIVLHNTVGDLATMALVVTMLLLSTVRTAMNWIKRKTSLPHLLHFKSSIRLRVVAHSAPTSWEHHHRRFVSVWVTDHIRTGHWTHLAVWAALVPQLRVVVVCALSRLGQHNCSVVRNATYDRLTSISGMNLMIWVFIGISRASSSASLTFSKVFEHASRINHALIAHRFSNHTTFGSLLWLWVHSVGKAGLSNSIAFYDMVFRLTLTLELNLTSRLHSFALFKGNLLENVVFSCLTFAFLH